MACTTVLVGKNASYDGSTMIARTHDAGSNEFVPHKFVVVKKEEQPKKYKSVLSHCEIDLPEEAMQYTALPRAVKGGGIWGGCGVNEVNVAMTATETLTSNERVLGADPLVELITDEDGNTLKAGGIGEEDIFTLVMPYIKTPKEGVKRLGMLLEKYGTYEMNGIAFQNESEIWWLETIGGHHWIAKKVPDDSYVVMPNQQGIDKFDLEDAFGEQKEHLCSADLREFIKDNHLDLSLNGEFNARFAFGSNADSDHTYNTPRSWIIHRYFNPSIKWDGENAEYKIDSDNIPWAAVPDRKITVEDVKYVLSHHYQGTEYDVYAKHNDSAKKGMLRPIGINRINHLSLVQIRPYMPKEIQCLQWITFGSNAFNALTPFYPNINKTPTYLANTTGKVSTDNLYWSNRLIAALSDAHYSLCSSHIERYQLAVQTKGRELVNKFDAEFKNSKIDNVQDFCEKANDEIANMLKEKTDDVLYKVLFTSSNAMKNKFARSDA